MLKRLSIEEKLIVAYLISLGIIAVLLYFYPTQFFNIYDKILFFMLQWKLTLITVDYTK
jgi:hypothetical protein